MMRFFLSAICATLLTVGAWAQTAPVIQESAPAATPAEAPASVPIETVPQPTSVPPEPVTSVMPTETPAAAPTTAPAPAPKPAPPAVAPKPAVPAGPRLVNLAPPAKRFGDGKMYVGHRYYEEKGGGWGWIKLEGDSWGSAKWVALKEDPFRGILIPSRKMGGRSADQDYEYKFTGYFFNKDAYDPHLDETMPIFVIESYQSLGPAKPLERKPGPPMRFTRSKKSRSSSREDRPIIQSPDSDSF